MFVSTTVPSVLSFLPRVTFSERASSTARSLSLSCLRSDQVCPSDEGGVVRSALQIEATKLSQDDRIGNEVFGVLIAPSIEPLDHQHPQDHLNRRGMTAESR